MSFKTFMRHLQTLAPVLKYDRPIVFQDVSTGQKFTVRTDVSFGTLESGTLVIQVLPVVPNHN